MALSRNGSLSFRIKYFYKHSIKYNKKLMFEKFSKENYEKSKEYGIISFKCAEKIKDDLWQLNSLVLCAMSHSKIKDISNLTNAVKAFEMAYNFSEKQSFY